MAYYRKKTEPQPPLEGEALALAQEKARAKTEAIKSASNEKNSREDRFIAKLQTALEYDLGDCANIDIQERNALYVTCVKFLAVLTKFGGDDDDGSYRGKD